MRCFENVLSVILVCVGALGTAFAQDTRSVTEPVIPSVCITLQGGVLNEAKPDTERIQAALDGCGAGKAVELAVAGKKGGGSAFLTGPLSLREGVTLLVDRGVTLMASSDPKAYDVAGMGLCGTTMPRPTALPVFSLNQAARPKGGCRPLISADGVKNAAIMGDGTIDGRGYAKVLGHEYSWWEMARAAQPKDDLYFTPKLIAADHADGFVLYKIRLVNSMNYHVTVSHTDGFTAWGVHLQTPVDKKLDARNTDGIDPGTSSNITVAHSWIDNGDDNIAIKQGVSHMSVLDNHFYNGHGMSIGSETVLGQSFLLVDGLTEDHTTSGIRIKSNVMRGGPVHDLVYRNVCMRDVPIPIAISPWYTNQTVEPFEDPKYKGEKVPDYKKIVLEKIYSETPGDVLIAGLDEGHRTEVSIDAVHIRGIAPGQVHMKYVDLVAKGCTDYPLLPGTNWSGTDGTVRLVGPLRAGCGASPTNPPDPCAGKFVPMQ